MKEDLTEREALVLQAIDALGSEAYGMKIHMRVEESPGSHSLGAVYVTAERLQERGFLVSWYGDPTPERGNRPKRFFRLTDAGATALAEYLRASLQSGIDNAPGATVA